MMAFLRGWQRRQASEIADERKMLQEKERKMLSNEVRWELKRYEELKERAAKFKEATGISLEYSLSSWDIRAIKLARHLLDADWSESRIDYHLKAMTRMCEEMKSVCAEMKALSGLEGTKDTKGIL